jgi:hypothetical protein
MKTKAFVVSALISLFISAIWSFGLWYAGKHLLETFLTILLGSYVLVVILSVFASLALAGDRKWQAACGSLSASSLFISMAAVMLAWHHHLTTGP